MQAKNVGLERLLPATAPTETIPARKPTEAAVSDEPKTTAPEPNVPAKEHSLTEASEVDGNLTGKNEKGSAVQATRNFTTSGACSWLCLCISASVIIYALVKVYRFVE